MSERSDQYCSECGSGPFVYVADEGADPPYVGGPGREPPVRRLTGGYWAEWGGGRKMSDRSWSAFKGQPFNTWPREALENALRAAVEDLCAVPDRDAYGRPLDCPWCEFVMSTWEDRERHINSHHPLAGKTELGRVKK